MTTLQECEMYFRAHGYGIHTDILDRLVVNYEGIKMIIYSNSGDTEFFKMDAIFGHSQFNASRLSLLEAASTVNRERKVVKCHIDDDNDIVLSTEILLDSTPQILDILPRLCVMIKDAAKTFVKAL